MKNNQIRTGAILSYISMAVKIIVSIIYTPIMLRLLGQNEFGLYRLVASVVSYLSIFNLGFGSAYVRFFSRYKATDESKEIEKLNGMFVLIFMSLGMLAILTGLVLVSNPAWVFGGALTLQELKTAQILLVILVVNLGLSFLNIVFDSYITANERFIFQKVIQILQSLVSPFVQLPLLMMGYGSIGYVIGSTLVSLFIYGFNFLYSVKKLNMRFKFGGFNLSLFKELLSYSSYIFIGMVIDQINWNIDDYLVGRFHGTAASAVYGIAAQIDMYYRNFSTAISSVLIPKVHQLVSRNADDETVTNFFIRTGRIQFVVLSLISSGFVFFGKPFIQFWAGEAYANSFNIALLLIIPVSVPLIQNIGIEIQRAKNKQKFRTTMLFYLAIFNLIITIPLTLKYEGIGAAVGTSLSLLIGNGIIMNWYYHNHIGINIKLFWKNIVSFVPALTIPIIYGILTVIFVDLYVLRNLIIAILIYLIIYATSMYFFGLNDYEKEKIF